MEGIQRFNLYVSTATVAVMFGIIEYVMPMLQASGIPPALLQLIPFAAPVQIVEASKLVIAALATLGTYRLLAKILIASIDHLPFIKPLIFGPSYVEGTWIGRFGAPTQLKWTVEHFEQDFAGIVIRGHAQNKNGTPYASWTSSAASVDPLHGTLTYMCNCDIIGHSTPQQGIGAFTFERANARKAPIAIRGYSTDLVDGLRSANHEIKISNKFLAVEEAMKIARGRFK
jgi:hypothetical protein